MRARIDRKHSALLTVFDRGSVRKRNLTLALTLRHDVKISVLRFRDRLIGRTSAFGAEYPGSSPGPGTKLPCVRFFTRGFDRYQGQGEAAYPPYARIISVFKLPAGNSKDEQQKNNATDSERLKSQAGTAKDHGEEAKNL